jgi:predicted nucleic acid-binding protein
VTRFVIGPDVALRLASERAAVARRHELLAPTLLRSQLLLRLYQAVRGGELERSAADAHLEYVRGLRIRLLGDRVLQRVAWSTADRLGWTDTLDAEYLALTHLQADAFVTLDAELAAAAAKVVGVAPYGMLLDGGG